MVSRIFSDADRQKRAEASRTVLRKWKFNGDRFVYRIVTTNETWLYYEPETKQHRFLFSIFES